MYVWMDGWMDVCMYMYMFPLSLQPRALALKFLGSQLMPWELVLDLFREVKYWWPAGALLALCTLLGCCCGARCGGLTALFLLSLACRQGLGAVAAVAASSVVTAEELVPSEAPGELPVLGESEIDMLRRRIAELENQRSCFNSPAFYSKTGYLRKPRTSVQWGSNYDL